MLSHETMARGLSTFLGFTLLVAVSAGLGALSESFPEQPLPPGLAAPQRPAAPPAAAPAAPATPGHGGPPATAGEVGQTVV